MQDNQPGQVIIPHNTDSSDPDTTGAGAPEPERPTEKPEPTPKPTTIPGQSEPASEASKAETPEESGWQFRSEKTGGAANRPAPALQPDEDLTWTASEFIAHEKTAGWYGMLSVAALLVVTAVYFITGHDIFSTGTVLVVAIAFGLFAGRQPKVLQYGLSGVGLHIGDKTYGYQDFKSFSVSEEGAIVGIVLTPLKRFMPNLTIYLAPEMEDKIVDVLAERLPMEQHRQDAVDGFLKRIRF
ncbi:MAG: hypothetical protein WC498_03735 [Candidatus Saccharimonadales bacterium]